jgi:hypothetical protein
MTVNPPKTTRRGLATVGAAVVAVVIAVAAVRWASARLDGDGWMPTDQEVRQRWRERRPDFEALRAMMDEDRDLNAVGGDRVHDCWSVMGDGRWSCPEHPDLDRAAMLAVVRLPAERYALYLRRLEMVGGERIERRSAGGVEVLLFRSGIAPSGASKSAVWLPAAPAPRVADTDSNRPGSYTVDYAPIADGWYVEHSSN